MAGGSRTGGSNGRELDPDGGAVHDGGGTPMARRLADGTTKGGWLTGRSGSRR